MKDKKPQIVSHDSTLYKQRKSIKRKLAEKALDKTDNEQMTQFLDEVITKELETGGEKSNLSKRASTIKENVALKQKAMLDPLARLKLDTIRAGQSYMDSIRKQSLRGMDSSQVNNKLDGLHRSYAQAMVLSSLKPLRSGLSIESVAQTIGMGLTMYMMSKNVRKLVGEFRPQVFSHIKSKVSKQFIAEGFGGAKGGPSISKRWIRRLNKLENGDRLPFTTKSAALTQVALYENAYAVMHDETVPLDKRQEYIESVQKWFGNVMQGFKQRIVDDGLDISEVDAQSRIIVGQRLETEPTLSSVFLETSHGQFTKTDNKSVYHNGKKITSWDGNFVDTKTNRVIKDGFFQLRPPLDVDQHIQCCSNVIKAQLEKVEDLEQLNNMFINCMIGSVARKQQQMSKQIDDEVLRKTVSRAESMFTSMKLDNIPSTQQKNVYACAFIDAMEKLEDKNPKLLKQWENQCGMLWRENVKGIVKSYSDGKGEKKEELLDMVKVSNKVSVNDVSVEKDDLEYS